MHREQEGSASKEHGILVGGGRHPQAHLRIPLVTRGRMRSAQSDCVHKAGDEAQGSGKQASTHI